MIRIEDDIVCTDDEPINLTEEAPKSIEDVEAICSLLWSLLDLSTLYMKIDFKTK